MDFSRIDEIARCGYKFASGNGVIPKLNDQIDVDAFNAGISNFNVRNGSNVPPLFERNRRLQDGANSRVADKELAIVGA